MRKKVRKLYPTTKKILLIAGLGAFIAGSFILPGLPKIFMGKKFNYNDFLEEDEWEPFDERRLRLKIKELQKQKMIKVFQSKEGFAVKVTKKGHEKLLKYRLDDLSVKVPEKWDRKWRLVAYDIPKEKDGIRDHIRGILKEMGFLQIQKSLYIYPYDCEEVIEFVRQVYRVAEHVSLLVVGSLEEEEAYKDYFNL